MLDVSSHGRAAPRTKSINVEANLLAERLAERERVRRVNLQKIGYVFLTLAVATAVLPMLRKWSAAEAKAYVKLDSQRSVLAAQLEDLTKRQDAAKPKLADEKLKSNLVQEASTFVGSIVGLLNSPPPKVVFDGLKVSLNAGNIEMTGKGSAETFDDYNGYANDPSSGIEIHGYRDSVELGPNGISFDFTKKVVLRK